MIPPKYRAMGIFVMFTLNNGFAWLMFDPIASWLKQNFKGMSITQVTLISSWQPITFILLSIPIMRLITQYDGLRKAVMIGTACEIAGSALKLIGALSHSSSSGLYFLHLGQILSAVGSPVATGSVSALSALWFEPEERTRSTGVAVLANSVGNSLCYLIVPFLTHHIGFFAVTLYELMMSFIAGSLTLLFFPKQPIAVPEENGGDASGKLIPVGEEEAPGEKPLIPQMKWLMSYSSVIMLFCVYAWSSGGFAAWISLFEATFHMYYSPTFIGFMCFCGMISFVLGGLVSSYLTDLYFSRQMKYFIFFCLSCNAVSCLMFVASLPDDGGEIMWDFGRPWILFVTSCCGFFNGGAAPLFYELVAEISFPVDEGVSGVAIAMCENVGALFFYQGVSRVFRGLAMNISYTAGMVVAVAVMSEVRQEYKRTYHSNAVREYLAQAELDVMDPSGANAAAEPQQPAEEAP